MKLEGFLQEKYGYNPDIKDAMRTYINQWKSWYQELANITLAEDFH